jgi:hypothetical protein
LVTAIEAVEMPICWKWPEIDVALRTVGVVEEAPQNQLCQGDVVATLMGAWADV